jgi:hypothetical protein
VIATAFFWSTVRTSLASGDAGVEQVPLQHGDDDRPPLGIGVLRFQTTEPNAASVQEARIK